MAKKEPVNMTWQTVFAFLPILYLIALYKVEKLTLGFAIALCFVLVGWTINDTLGSSELHEFPSNGEYDYGYYIAAIIHTIISVVTFVYLIRRWSREWNEKIFRMSR